MSSDESDHESGLSQYRILLPKWRNPQLAAWLRVFDAIHRTSRFRPDQTRAGRGARPRLRVVGQAWSTSTSYVSQLPLNAYNPIWLARLNVIEKEDVDAQEDEHYDFSHNPDVAAYVQSIRCIPLRNLILLFRLAVQTDGRPNQNRTYA